MPRKIETPLNPQIFTDGAARIYQTKNTAGKGNRPVYTATLLMTLPYEEQKVTDARYYAAMQADSRLDKVLRFPRVSGLQPSGDIVTLAEDGYAAQYRVTKIARNTLTYPESMDVTLEIPKQTYTLKEADEDDG